MFKTDRIIERNTPIPLYFQMKEIILEQINLGNVQPDESIPTELELCKIYQISRTTIRQAIMELVKEGYLYRIKSKGTYVSKPKIERQYVKKIDNYNNHIRSLGMLPSTQVLELEVETVSREVQEKLRLKTGDRMIKLVRVRSADDEPIVIVISYLSYERCAYVLSTDFSSKSLYEALAMHPEHVVYRTRTSIEAVLAGEFECMHMNVLPGDPILLTKATTYTKAGSALEYTVTYHRGDRNKFEVELCTEKTANQGAMLE